MSSYILCKILSFETCLAQKVFNTSRSYSLVELIVLRSFNIQNWFICRSIRTWIAYANEANIVNKDSPIREGWHHLVVKRENKNLWKTPMKVLAGRMRLKPRAVFFCSKISGENREEERKTTWVFERDMWSLSVVDQRNWVLCSWYMAQQRPGTTMTRRAKKKWQTILRRVESSFFMESDK